MLRGRVDTQRGEWVEEESGVRVSEPIHTTTKKKTLKLTLAQTSGRDDRIGSGTTVQGLTNDGYVTGEDLTLSSAALELEHGHTDRQEQHYPRDGGHESQVHVGFQQVPSAGQYAPQ